LEVVYVISHICWFKGEGFVVSLSHHISYVFFQSNQTCCIRTTRWITTTKITSCKV